MSKNKAIGTRLYIGGFGPLASEATWVQVSHIQDIPEIGHIFSEITWDELDSGDTQYEKGARGTTPLTVLFTRNDTDDGQADLQAAADDDTADRFYNFKVEWGPAVTGTGNASPTSVFKANVLSFVDVIGNSGNMINGSAQLRIKTGTIGFTPRVTA